MRRARFPYLVNSQRTFVAMAASLLLPFASLHAVTTTYDNQGSFLGGIGALGGDYVTEDFTTTNTDDDPMSLDFGPYAGSSISFTISTVEEEGGVNGLFKGTHPDVGDWLGTLEDENPLTITFSPGVRSVGGNFFLTDFDGEFLAGDFAITINGGEPINLFSSAETALFFGIISDVEIASIEITTSAPASFVTVANLSVSNIPEPGTLALAGAGLAGALLLRRRRTAR